jgi:NAD(P)-dependent dehydrogenase (short-subunit alcohol dehydrogenase family)
MEILITGANRGIGAALRAAYSSQDDKVTGTTRQVDCPQGWLTMDVTDPASISHAVAEFGEKALDLLICNAGTYPEKGEGRNRYGASDWASGFAVNATGVFLTITAFLPNLRRAPGPKIAIIASQMGSSARAPGGSYIYRASKAAAINIGRNLAADLKPEGIAIGIYHPGWVRTDMGGSAAAIDTETSAKGLMARFAALGPATSGCFEDYTGRSLEF